MSDLSYKMNMIEIAISSMPQVEAEKFLREITELAHLRLNSAANHNIDPKPYDFEMAGW